MNYKTFNKTLMSIYVFCFFLCCAFLYANDTKITVSSGGIVIENKEPDIEMVSEKLEISLKKIKVSYVFLNHGKSKKIKIGFPLPRSPYFLKDEGSYTDIGPYPTWDEANFALRTLCGDTNTAGFYSLSSQLSQAEIIDFEVSIGGNTVNFERHMRAHKQNSEDITDVLKKHNIPISSAYLIGHQEEPPMHLFPGLKEKLAELKLLDKNGKPNWYVQTTYAWEYEFLANVLTNVKHSYTPSHGSYWIYLKDLDDQSSKDDVKAPKEDLSRRLPLNIAECTVDSGHFKRFMEIWKAHVKDHGPDRTFKRLEEIQYVLKTLAGSVH